LGIRSTNLAVDYLNALSDQPFLQKRPEPDTPNRNVVHRSDQHQWFYTTDQFDEAGRRVEFRDLAPEGKKEHGKPVDRFNKEPMDQALDRQFERRSVPIAPAPEQRKSAAMDAQEQAIEQHSEVPKVVQSLPSDFALVRALPKNLRDPDHPGHERYIASLDSVRRMESRNGIESGTHSERLAAAVAIAVERDQLKVQRLELDKSTGQVAVVERGAYPNSDERRVPIDTRQILAQSFEQSSQQWLDARSPHYSAGAPTTERTRGQSEALAQLSPADQAMFAKIREGIPASVSDDHVAQAVLAAKRDGMIDASKINQVAMVGDKLWVEGTIPGYRAAVDVSQQAPQLQETVMHAKTFNQHRDLELAQEAQQRTQTDLSQGPKIA